MTESGFVEIAKGAVEIGSDGIEVHSVHDCPVRVGMYSAAFITGKSSRPLLLAANLRH